MNLICIEKQVPAQWLAAKNKDVKNDRPIALKSKQYMKWALHKRTSMD
jgi:hypothetical protein